jgi:hypothetical protein
VPGQALPEPGGSGQVAVPAGPRAMLSVGAVPDVRDGTDPTGGATTAVVRVLGADGAQLAEQELALTPGRLQRLDLASLAGGGTPALVTVDGAPEARIVWGVELSASGEGAPEALVATLTPTPALDAAGTVRVRAVDARG